MRCIISLELFQVFGSPLWAEWNYDGLSFAANFANSHEFFNQFAKIGVIRG